jgi:hypothetical protein
MLHDCAELRWLHEAVNPTTASCRSCGASFVLSEVDDTLILRTGLPTPSQLPAQLVADRSLTTPCSGLERCDFVRWHCLTRGVRSNRWGKLDGYPTLCSGSVPRLSACGGVLAQADEVIEKPQLHTSCC